MKRSFSSRAGGWPVYGSFGLGLVILFWILNWSLPGFRTQWGFFPLWLGYCLTVDALVFMKKDHSLLVRNPKAYAALFFISAPSWWLFEIINWRTQNWFYIGEEHFSDLEYFFLSSLSFSTVMPAVFGTAELAGTFRWIGKLTTGFKIPVNPSTTVILFAAGWIMLALMLVWPLYFFPFVWISVYCILDPINVWLGNRTLLQNAADGDWRSVIALWCGCLICGFFWEMWNYYSYPKWIYQVPFVDFLHIFEMPLPGYLGYIPFSMELFALYHLVTGPLKPGRGRNDLQFLPDERNYSI
jgi:hypothetical protein